MAPPKGKGQPVKGKGKGQPVKGKGHPGKGKSPQEEEGNGRLSCGKDGWEELQLYLAAVGSNDEDRHKGRWAMIKGFLQDNGVEFLVYCRRQREKATLGAPITKPGRCPMCQDTGFVLLQEEEPAVVVKEEEPAVVVKKEELDIPLDEEEGGVDDENGASVEGETSSVQDCASLEEGIPASNADVIVLDLPHDDECEESLEGSGAEGEVALFSCPEVPSTHPPAPNEPEMQNHAVEGNKAISAAAASDRPATPTGNDKMTLRSGKRRIPAEVALVQSESDTVQKTKKSKAPAPDPTSVSSPSPEKVLELKVEDITVHSPAGAQDCCLPIDVQMWEEILHGCDSKSAILILLPEGSFFFPPNYDLKAKADFRSCNLRISGKGAEATFLCLHYPAKRDPFTYYGSLLNLHSSLTLEKMTVKYHGTDPEEDPLQPRVGIFADNCRVKDVNFVGCTLDISSKGNVVEHCNFSSFRDIKPFNLDDVYDTAVELGSDWDDDDGNSGGNIIRNIFIQNLHSGVCNYGTNNNNVSPEPDLIENVTCRNVWRGVFLKNCCGDTVKDLTCEWDDDLHCFETVVAKLRPTAVHIHDSEGTTLDGLTCKGETVVFNAFTITRSSGCSLLNRKNKIRNVKGAKGRYVNESEDTEITNVHD